MKRIRILLHPGILILFLIFSAPVVLGQNDQDRDQITTYTKKAQELLNANKNSQALYYLELAGKNQVSGFSKERTTQLKSIESEFGQNKQKRLSEISRKGDQIRALQAGNEDIDRENLKMIRNTLLFFGTLVLLIVILLLNRFRKLAFVKEQVINTEAQLLYSEKVISSESELKKIADTINSKWSDAKKHLDVATPTFNKIKQDKHHPLFKTVAQVEANVLAGIRMLEPKNESAEKQSVDLNQMIEEVAGQAYHLVCAEHPEFNCLVMKDLEKILPKVELVPDHIRFVIFNLLKNAFQSIREKRSDSPKGYEPKVTISSRKLPRFVQIRVRDNGIGIQAKNPDQVFEAFQSDKNAENHAGLGLSESKRLITGVYKGELFIESDLSNSTDFIIRFPIHTIM